MKVTNHSSIQEQEEYNIASNPELQVSELAPKAKDACWHEKIYKTLATVGDFKCYVWYFDNDYDELRTTEGTKRIHIVGTEQRIEDEEELNKYLGISDMVFTEGVIYVNAIIRPNGTTYQNNKDLKDCVKYMSGVANHYGASKDKIVSIDPLDDDKMYDMNYDVTSAKTYSDVSNNVLNDFTSGTIGNGSLAMSYSTAFGSGSISMGDIKSKFGASNDNNIDKYHRGENIANITQNNNIPTSGEISFSDFRNVVDGITGNANGNWMHLQARWEVFGDNAWTSGVKKTLNITGNIGPADESNPAVRINSGGNGEIIVKVQSGSYPVRGWPGLGGGASQAGQAGNIAMHVASPIKMPTTHYNGRVGGGGGGGGGGGKGGQGGSGGHNGGRRCNGGFCWNTHQYCNGDGGSGGAGGAGGAGGRGNGYYYDYANGIWQRVNNNSNIGASGAGGSQGASGSGRAAQGGTGGQGGQGGGLEQSGDNGNTGNTGGTGAGQYGSCGVGGDGSRAGSPGEGGKGGGGNSGKISTSNTGNVTLT